MRVTRLQPLLPLLVLAVLPEFLAAAPPVSQPVPGTEQAEEETLEAGVATYGATPAELVPYKRLAAPYRSLYEEPFQYRGPERDSHEPKSLESVRIGLLAPLEDGTPDAELGRSIRSGVVLALEEANRQGGYQGLPFELVARNDQAIWGASSNTLVEFAYNDRVWAVIGSTDSNSTHVALRAALKAELMIVNVGASDPTLTETGIPWIVRLTPDDRQISYALAELLFNQWDLDRVALLRTTDRYGRLGVTEFKTAARRLGRPLPMEILVRPGQADSSAALARVLAVEP